MHRAHMTTRVRSNERQISGRRAGIHLDRKGVSARAIQRRAKNSIGTATCVPQLAQSQ
jgi:hypothetical protein